MKSIRHAMRIARRYADGGGDDDVPPGGTPPGPQLGPHLGRVLEMQPLSPDKPSETHGTMHTPYMPIPRGEPPPEPAPIPAEPLPGSAVKPHQPTTIQHWSQAIADHLVSRHGDDYPAAEEAIRDIGTNYSQRAANAVWEKMPLEHQMGMMDARMQDDLGPAAYRMATDPANFQQRQQSQEHRGWLGELLQRNAAEPPSRTDYVSPYGIHAQQIPKEELPPAPNEPEITIGGKPVAPTDVMKVGDIINHEQFFGLDPEHVPYMSDQQVADLWNHYIEHPDAYKELQEKHPDLARAFLTREADATRILHPEWQQAGKEHVPLTEEEYGAGPEHTAGQLPTENPFYATKDEHPFNSASRQSLDAFKNDIAPQTKDKNIFEFAKRFFGGYDTSRIDYKSYGGIHVLEGDLMDGNNHVAHISRDFSPANEVAHHGSLEINPNYRGTAGPRILRGQFDTYKALGLDHISVTAGLDGGGYAWARYGFIPSKYGWDALRNKFLDDLNNGTLRSALDGSPVKLDNPRDVARLRRIFEWNDPRGIWDLADHPGTVNGSKQTIGNALLAGNHWSGTFNLKDPISNQRFDRYVRKKLEKAQGKKPASD